MPLVRKPSAAVSKTSTESSDVLKELKSSNADERWRAARAATEMAGGARALASALTDETDARVREVILTGLAKIDSAESVDAILPLLRSDDASLRTGALDALRSMHSAVRGYLPSLLKDPDTDVRVLCCEIAANLSSDDATALLSELLDRETDANVCAAAIEVLTEIGTAAALPVLAKCEVKFQTTPFLTFAIKIAADRIRSRPASAHV